MITNESESSLPDPCCLSTGPLLPQVTLILISWTFSPWLLNAYTSKIR